MSKVEKNKGPGYKTSKYGNVQIVLSLTVVISMFSTRLVQKFIAGYDFYWTSTDT